MGTSLLRKCLTRIKLCKCNERISSEYKNARFALYNTRTPENDTNITGEEIRRHRESSIYAQTVKIMSETKREEYMTVSI